MTERTFSVREYAAIVLGPGPGGGADDVEPFKLQWLEKRLRSGALPGYKVGRRWRATQEDIDTAIELLRPKRVPVPMVPTTSSMTRTSRRRLSA